MGAASGPAGTGELKRHLGVLDAVVIGLGSMIGAGIFAALAPAAGAAGSGLLLGLALAAVVAYCNAMSSARLAARHPASGGTYVYGRERLGEFWGYLAGWAFVVGKTASCAAMALTVGSYVWPGQAHAVAVAAVVALTAVNYAGVQKSAWLTRVIVAVVLAVLVAVVVAAVTSGDADAARLGIGDDATFGGVLQAAGLLFFAFAGYARIATLGEEVRDPARTIPRAIPLALGITLALYAAVAVAVLLVLGPQGLADAIAPLSDAARAAARTGWRRSYGWAPRLPRSAHCSPWSSGSRARPWRWPATSTCPTPWPPSIRDSRCRTAPNSWSAPSSPCSPRPPTYAGRSASLPSGCSPTTPSPMPLPGRSPPTRADRRGSSRSSEWPAASSWPSPSRPPRSLPAPQS